MTNSSALPRVLMVFGIVIPLAVVVGLLLASPDTSSSVLLLLAVAGVLVLPVFLRWHHPLLVFGWNAAITLTLLPGQPPLWMLLVLISLSFSIVNLAMDKEHAFIRVPSLNWPLLALVVVTLVTAKLTGGFAVRALGSSGAYGGKWYFYVLLAVAGYYALISRRIPRDRAVLYTSIFLLSGLTSVIGNIAYSLGPSFYWLFYLFPTDMVVHQVNADYKVGEEIIVRLSGLAFAGVSAVGFMLMRYGIKGLLDFSKPWRLPVFILTIFASAFGGFRSVLVMFALALIIQFFLEGLHRTRLPVAIAVAGIGLSAVLLPFAHKLPLSVQRSISFLPVDVDPVARMDARNSLNWRLDMWRILLPEVPRYFFLGKGYAVNATDLYMSVYAERHGYAKPYEKTIASGNYHSGPLSLMIPFGIWGLLAFGWFLWAAVKVLWRNYRYGDPDLQKINTFILSFFLMRIVFYFVFFGAFSNDLYHFTGLLGLSISLNGGVAKVPEPSSQRAPAPGTAVPRLAV